VRRAVDGRGLPYENEWRVGRGDAVPAMAFSAIGVASRRIDRALHRVALGGEDDIATLFEADGEDLAVIAQAACDLRRERSGETITYVVNRNINYTNICLYKCGFCAFSKGASRELRGPAYRLDMEEVGRRAAEAWERGATEVCLQGGIHPDYDGHTYLNVVKAVRAAAPGIHIHAFSPLEITHGAETLGLSLSDFLWMLKEAGLSTLPGTAAEVLDDQVRAVLCPDKLNTAQWLDVMRAAHDVGLKSTATIMFGHVDSYRSWARHLTHIRNLQEEAAGFTEFVPLPFVHMEAPIWRKGNARSGPSYRETVLMHAIARLVLDPLIPNIQTSWVKLGTDGATAMLRAGANDLGGILMDESITRAAGGVNGQCCSAEDMQTIADALGRPLVQRTTLYESVIGHRTPARGYGVHP
jgi:FO synthase